MMQLFYRELGEGNQENLIILHGLFGSSDNWLTIGKALAHRFHIYIIDQRNHGQSFHSDDWNYKFMVEDLKTFIEEKAIENPILMGHSMGGKTVMQFAAMYPELLEKLIVVDIAPKAYPIHHHQILKGLNSLKLNDVKSRGAADKQLQSYVPEMGVRMFLLKNLYRKEDNSFGWRINLPVITEKIAEVGEPLIIDDTIDTDTLFISGANSDYILPQDVPVIENLFTNGEVVEIPNAGHWVHAEKGEDFVHLVNQWV